jgi:hypothetical protein
VSPTFVGETVGDSVGSLLGTKLGFDDGDTEGKGNENENEKKKKSSEIITSSIHFTRGVRSFENSKLVTNRNR